MAILQQVLIRSFSSPTLPYNFFFKVAKKEENVESKAQQ